MKLYHDRIIDHYHNPRNYGVLENPDVQCTVTNKSCGDIVTVYLHHKDHKVSTMFHTGEGCVISRAAASLLSEHVSGKSFDELFAYDEEFILNLIKIELGPVRLKCALLPLEALIKALKEICSVKNNVG